MVALSLIALLELSSILGVLVLPKLDIQWAAVMPSVVTLLTNDERAKNNLSQLKVNPLLEKAAQAKAEDMAAKGYFAHQSPDGTMPWQWINKAGYVYEYAGENLAVNFSDTEQLVEAWMNSPTHKMNLLGPRYTEIGVGMATGEYKGREAVFIVQMFASPVRTAAVPSSPKPNSPRQAVVQEPVRPVAQEPAVSVLGAETQTIPSPSSLVRVASSPRTYTIYVMSAVAMLFLGVLVIGWGRHHPQALLHGVVVVGVIAGIFVINRYIIFPSLELAPDSQNAAVILSGV